MNELVAKRLEQLAYLGANFQLTYEKDNPSPWRLDVRCEGMQPFSAVATRHNLLWVVTFAFNTVIDETRKEEGIPLYDMPAWIE